MTTTTRHAGARVGPRVEASGGGGSVAGASADVAGGLGAVSEWGPRLEALLDRQLGLYGSLDGLSREQSAAVRTAEPDALLSVLGRRERVLRAIHELNRELSPFTSSWDALSKQLDDERRSALRSKLDALEGLVKQIAERDESDRRALEERRGAMARELSRMASGKAAAAAYGGVAKPTGAVDARFQDRRG